jgi:signal transduction histidine kinase
MRQDEEWHEWRMEIGGTGIMKLARKIVLVMLATFLGVFAVLGYFDASRVVRESHTRVAHDLATTGHALSPALAEVSAVEGGVRARQLLDRADADLEAIQVRWRSLEELGSSQRAALLRGEDVTVDDESTNSITVFVPVHSLNGALELSQVLTPRRKALTGVLTMRFAVSGIAVLVAAILSIIAALGIIGAPMRMITNHARRIGSGDLSQRLALSRHDEIGTLAAEMNVMCDQLTAAQARFRAETDAKLKAEEQVRHADRMSVVGTLAAGMAHELGTPLSVIAGRTQMIATSKDVSPQVVKYAEVVAGQVERMTKIMRGLLDFARSTPTKKSTTDLRDLTRRILDLLGPLAMKHNVTLQVTPDAEAASVQVDSAQVEQAVANLVVNGIQAMTHPGTIDADVRRVHVAAPGAREATDFVCVSVRDSGSGIGEDKLSHIFEPFFTTKDVGEGTGLGLSVTYGIVHEHGGFVDVRSTLNVGTCVSLYFPA